MSVLQKILGITYPGDSERVDSKWERIDIEFGYRIIREHGRGCDVGVYTMYVYKSKDTGKEKLGGKTCRGTKFVEKPSREIDRVRYKDGFMVLPREVKPLSEVRDEYSA